jgi:hypothetical protein
VRVVTVKDAAAGNISMRESRHCPSKVKSTSTRCDSAFAAERLGEFSLAGDDRKWYWAEARIEGDAVVVSSKAVPSPVAARYAWQANPAATLFSGAGLPATPFRTDDWLGVTVGHTVY